MPVIIPCCYMRGLAHPWRCGTSVAHRRWRDLVTTTRVNGRPYRVQTRGVIFREPVGNTLHTLSSLCLLSVLCTLSTTISKTTRDPNSLSGPAHHRFGITGVSVPLSSAYPGWSFEGSLGFCSKWQGRRSGHQSHKCVGYGSSSKKQPSQQWTQDDCQLILVVLQLAAFLVSRACRTTAATKFACQYTKACDNPTLSSASADFIFSFL